MGGAKPSSDQSDEATKKLGWATRVKQGGLKSIDLVQNRLNLFYIWEKRWLFVALAVGASMVIYVHPSDLSDAGVAVLAMSVVATILFITEPVPLPTVALLIIVGQVLLLGIDSTDVAKSLMTDSVLFIMGSLMLAVAIVKQRLDKRIAWLIVRLTGTKTSSICFGISLVSGVLASFVGEHTVAAMMLPVGITLITLTSDNPAPFEIWRLLSCFRFVTAVRSQGLAHHRVGRETPS